MSQRVDLNSDPAVGWKLFLYQANTSTPVNSYADQGLSILNPWPLVADGYGMMGEFWLADGSYRARGTSNDGSQTYFDRQNILAVGGSTSSGGGGGGGTIDTSQIFQTGDVMWLDTQGTRTGWVRDNGKTIGSATSGGTERANADTSALFQFLWNNFSNAICPVPSGRGASAAADFSANKQITLPDRRGCALVGLDDMGNSAAGNLASAPIVVGGVTTGGSIVGESGHTLSSGEMPAHNHTASSVVSESPHLHAIKAVSANSPAGAGNAYPTQGTFGTGTAQGNTETASTGLTVATTTTNTGGGGAHNTIQRSALGTVYRKL